MTLKFPLCVDCKKEYRDMIDPDTQEPVCIDCVHKRIDKMTAEEKKKSLEGL